MALDRVEFVVRADRETRAFFGADLRGDDFLADFEAVLFSVLGFFATFLLVGVLADFLGIHL